MKRAYKELKRENISKDSMSELTSEIKELASTIYQQIIQLVPDKQNSPLWGSEKHKDLTNRYISCLNCFDWLAGYLIELY